MNLSDYLAQSNQATELQSVVLSLSTGVEKISKAIINCHTGAHGDQNASGEEQMALDVLSNELLEEDLKSNDAVYCYASEEEEDLVVLNTEGTYSVAFDPLDGSSLIDTNLSIGTIFGVYESEGFLGKKGNEQVCAGYAVYGPRTTFVFSFGDTVVRFLLQNGEWILDEENFSIKEDTKYFSPGNLRACNENTKYSELVQTWMQEQKTLRYSGGMVPDINLIFCKGEGIFTYPGHSKHPNGKLRLLFECAPFAFVAQAAGGIALDKNGTNILDLEISDVHERTTIFIGSKNEVERTVKVLQN